MMLPDDWRVRSNDDEVNGEMCDAVQHAAGFILVSDALFEIITWQTHGDATVWTLRRCRDMPRA